VVVTGHNANRIGDVRGNIVLPIKIVTPTDHPAIRQQGQSVKISSRDGEALFRDAGTRVFSLARDAVSMEAFVRLSQLKYGKELYFFGDDDFIKLSIKTAADKGIRLELADAGQAALYQQALKQQREIDTSRSTERGSPRTLI